VWVDAAPTTVADDLAEVTLRRELVAGLLDPASTDEVWVLPGIAVAGLGVRAAARIRVVVDARAAGRSEVRVIGTPVDGHTPCWLDVAIESVAAGAGSAVTSTFRVEVDLPLPRLTRPVAQLVLEREVTRVRDTLIGRIADHYDVVAA
jgi:hypothetical protein